MVVLQIFVVGLAIVWGDECCEDCASKECDRRRFEGQLEDGSQGDLLCERVMAITREHSRVEKLVHQVGKSNAKRVAKGAAMVTDACERLGDELTLTKTQCLFYVNQALAIDPEILERAWLFAYGTGRERQRGCGMVVTQVNEVARRRMEMVPPQEGGMVAFVDARRRLAAIGGAVAAGTGAVAAGTGLAVGYMCESFDPVTFAFKSSVIELA